LETAPGHPGLLALAQPWLGARDHRERMQRAAHVSATIVLTRDRAGGRVSVRREGHAAIDYRPGARELAHLRSGLALAVRAQVAAGADEVLTLHSRPHRLRTSGASAGAVEDFCERIQKDAIDRNWSTLFSAHQMGTCRMGADRRSCVCDEDGRVGRVHGLYVADASLFPASSGVNPMITVMALARHVAARVVSAGSGKRVARP
jgi:choline dehydrogenase-like flavoprotein